MTSSTNRKYITYRYAATGGPSRGHGQHAQKFGENRTCSSEAMIADRQTHRQTDRQTDRQTRSSRYWAGMMDLQTPGRPANHAICGRRSSSSSGHSNNAAHLLCVAPVTDIDRQGGCYRRTDRRTPRPLHISRMFNTRSQEIVDECLKR